MRPLELDKLAKINLHDHEICSMIVTHSAIELRLGLDKECARYRFLFEDVAYLEIGATWCQILSWQIVEAHPRIDALVREIREEWQRDHDLEGEPIPGDEHLPQWFCWQFYGTGSLAGEPWMTIIAERVEGWGLLPEGEY